MVDTDVASHLHRGTVPPGLRSALVGVTIEITFVTVAELLAWPEMRGWGPRRRRDLDDWIDAMSVLPPGRLVAESYLGKH